ncbi:hypothetical protein GUITHDRAFT_73969, partial [Guillardia theta CCMP2712]
GAVNVPAFLDTPQGRLPVREDFLKRMLQKFPDKNSKIVVGCQRGIRSAEAASWLCEVGYTNIVNQDGGCEAAQAPRLMLTALCRFSYWVTKKDLPTEA